MEIKPSSQSMPVQVSGTPGTKARTVEEAAHQFEEVLARQFVQVMTKDLFKENLSGEDGPGWMEGQASMQRDILTDVLSKRLTENGGLGLSELLVRQWQQKNRISPVDSSGSPETPE